MCDMTAVYLLGGFRILVLKGVVILVIDTVLHDWDVEGGRPVKLEEQERPDLAGEGSLLLDSGHP